MPVLSSIEHEITTFGVSRRPGHVATTPRWTLPAARRDPASDAFGEPST